MVLVIFALASCVVLPIGGGVLGGKGIHLGLDLVGGSHLVYQAQFPEGITVEEKARAMDRALDTIRTRIDKYGVLEPVIQEQEGERILVQLPAFTDIEEAKNLVTLLSLIAVQARLKPVSIAAPNVLPVLNSSFTRSKIRTLASTAMPMDRTKPQIPAKVRVTPPPGHSLNTANTRTP
ncbi:unnamed protein product [marine sediment metagenome]|uniref:Protein translocase subunit SecDF P1 domain-containing protein n=1 Tax=marine sediment metagenome TaxID=412755 RepID=X1SSB1_9ZZZZ